RGWGLAGFGVRVGVDTGPVVLGPVGAGSRAEYGAFGDTVNTAARLQAAAAPGAVLVGEDTVRLVETAFEWGPPQEVEAKGKAEPVPARTALRSLGATGRSRGLPGVHTPLVGRERELDVAREAMAEVLAGAGSILFVTGEPGIGKSRLLAEIRDAFEESAAAVGEPTWLEGKCVSYGESFPYWPFRDLVRDWLEVGFDDPELRVRVALRRRLERLFGDRALEVYPYLGAMLGLALEPDAAARLADLSPEALQYRTFEVVRALFRRLAESGPVVVAVEDLHWADPTSVQLTESLLGLAEESAVLLLVALRPERDHPAWAVREAGGREYPHRTREIALEALSGDAQRELLHALVGPDVLPEHLERQLLDDAEGNPFYLEELVRSLADQGALVQEEGEGWRFDHLVAVEVPPSVEKVILARIDRLSPRCHDLITAASVLGRRFGISLLEGVAGANGDLRESLHDLERLDLVREARRWPQPEYRFKHALIQEAAYRTLVTPKRRALHRRAAEWLERWHAENPDEAYGLLAHHWLEADDEDKAVSYLALAGDKARLEYALDEAINHYRNLL
ncbi:MAG TPA: AAA family ATPase, partial [Myxococcaceae bacterium]